MQIPTHVRLGGKRVSADLCAELMELNGAPQHRRLFWLILDLIFICCLLSQLLNLEP